MTEQQWQQSADPAAMWQVVAPTATERQCKHFVEACRTSLNDQYHWVGVRNYKDAASDWCNRPAYLPQLPKDFPLSDLLREIFGNPWRRYASEDGILYLDALLNQDIGKYLRSGIGHIDEWLRWENSAIPRMAQAISGEIITCPNCLGCGGPERCDFCNQTGRIMTAFDPAVMPLIADMLEEAGCLETSILDHLRGRERWDCASMCGHRHNDNCSLANGTGFKPANHVRGCWALELFIQTKE
jgi:hypothetical protein